jgi:two-component system sensor histidine kinase VicK
MLKNIRIFLKSKNKIAIFLFIIGLLMIFINIFIKTYIINIILLLIFIILFIILFKNKIDLIKIEKINNSKPNQLELIMNNMNEGVIIYNSDFIIQEINPVAEKILNIKKTEIINKKITPNFINNKKLKTLAQIIFPSLAPKVIQLSDNDWPQITEITLKNNYSLISTLLRINDEDNKSVSFIKIIQNKNKEDEENEEKTDFITVSAHQLKNELEKIKKIFEKIINQKGLDKKEIEKGLNISKKNIENVKKILKVNVLKNNYTEYNFEKINITSLIKKSKEKAEIIANQYNIKINVNYKEDLYIIGDKEKIMNLLSIIIDNAIRYNNEGGFINIDIEKDINFAEIIISDTGIGIEKENLDKIFEKYYQTNQGKKYNSNGTGLGLYIAKKIIKKHNGQIWVDSIIKRGSNFHFTLPLYK